MPEQATHERREKGRAAPQRERGRLPVVRRCPVCKGRFSPRRNNPGQVLCSRRCANTHAARVSAERRGDMLRFRTAGSGRSPYPYYKGVRAHRYFARYVIGRPLEKGEGVVHHKNGNKKDFHPRNIEVFGAQGAHMRQHVKNRPCCLHGCGRKHRALGFCGLHYHRWRRYGTPFLPGETPWACTWGNCTLPPGADGLCERHRPLAADPIPF